MIRKKRDNTSKLLHVRITEHVPEEARGILLELDFAGT